MSNDEMKKGAPSFIILLMIVSFFLYVLTIVSIMLEIPEVNETSSEGENLVTALQTFSGGCGVFAVLTIVQILLFRRSLKLGTIISFFLEIAKIGFYQTFHNYFRSETNFETDWTTILSIVSGLILIITVVFTIFRKRIEALTQKRATRPILNALPTLVIILILFSGYIAEFLGTRPHQVDEDRISTRVPAIVNPQESIPVTFDQKLDFDLPQEEWLLDFAQQVPPEELVESLYWRLEAYNNYTSAGPYSEFVASAVAIGEAMGLGSFSEDPFQYISNLTRRTVAASDDIYYYKLSQNVTVSDIPTEVIIPTPWSRYGAYVENATLEGDVTNSEIHIREMVFENAGLNDPQAVKITYSGESSSGSAVLSITMPYYKDPLNSNDSMDKSDYNSVLTNLGINYDDVFDKFAQTDGDLVYVNDFIQRWVQYLPSDPTVYDEAAFWAAAVSSNATLDYDTWVELDPGAKDKPAAGEDMIDWFMDRGKGLPVHFASTLCLVLRLQGIPARVVRGLAAGIATPGERTRTLKGLVNEHYWVEVLIPLTDGNYTWAIFDATPLGCPALMEYSMGALGYGTPVPAYLHGVKVVTAIDTFNETTTRTFSVDGEEISIPQLAAGTQNDIYVNLTRAGFPLRNVNASLRYVGVLGEAETPYDSYIDAGNQFTSEFNATTNTSGIAEFSFTVPTDAQPDSIDDLQNIAQNPSPENLQNINNWIYAYLQPFHPPEIVSQIVEEQVPAGFPSDPLANAYGFTPFLVGDSIDINMTIHGITSIEPDDPALGTEWLNTLNQIKTLGLDVMLGLDKNISIIYVGQNFIMNASVYDGENPKEGEVVSFQLCDLVDIQNPTVNSMQPGELLYDALDTTNSSGQVEREHSFDASYMNDGIEYTYSGLIFKLRFIKTFIDDIHLQYTPFLLTGDVYQLDVFTVKDAYDFDSIPPNFEGDVGQAFLYHTYPLYAKLTSFELVGDNYTQVGQPGEVIQFTIFNSTYSRALSNVTTNGNGTAIYEWYIDDFTLLTTPTSESFKIKADWINGSGDLTQESILDFDIKNPFGISVGPPSSLTMALDHDYSIGIIAYERWFDYNIYPILDQNGNPNETLMNLYYDDTVTPRLRNVSATDVPENMEVVMYYGGTSDPIGTILSCNNNTLIFPIRYRSDETIAGPTFPDTDEYLTFTLRNDSTHMWGTNTTQGLYSYQIIESVGEVITTTEIGGPTDNKLVATLSTGESVYFNITLTDSEGLGSGRFDNGTINVDLTKTGELDHNVGFKTWSDNSTFLGLNGSNFDITFTWDLPFITSVSPADYSGDVTFVITWTDAFGELKLIGEIDFILEFNAVP